jgi:gas vesicle protein
VARQRKSSGQGFLFGLIVGLIVGAILALIFAHPSDVPDQGNFTDVLRRRYGEALEQSKEAYARAKDEVLTRYSRAKSGDFTAV